MDAGTLTALLGLAQAAVTATDLGALLQQADTLLRAALPGIETGYYRRQDSGWVAEAADRAPDQRPTGPETRLPEQLNFSAPGSALAAAQGELVFVDEWCPEPGPQRAQDAAAAFAPFLVDGRSAPIGLFAVVLPGRARWSPGQQQTVTAVWQSLLLAINRAEQQREQERSAALDAFVTLTEAIGTETDQERLALRATRLVRSFLPELSAVYYRLDDGLWRARVISEDVSPDLAAALRAGLPQDTPSLAEAVIARGPLFVDGWNSAAQGFPASGDYGAAAFYPYYSAGQPTGLLAIGTQQARVWTPTDRTVFMAAGRSLGLALDWASQTERLQTQNETLDGQAQASDAFAAFTEAVGTETDVTQLARQAVAVLGQRFPESSTGYYEREDERWKLRVSSENLTQDPDALAQDQAGLPLDTPVLRRALQTRAATFVDQWDAGAQGAEVSAPYTSVGTYPLLVHGEVRAILATGLTTQTRWAERDQAVFRAVGRGLTLALERADQAQVLQASAVSLRESTAELEARTAALEAFAQLTGELSVQLDPHQLVRRAQEVALALLSRGYALYYERDGRHWRNRVQVGDVGNAELQAFIDAGPLVGETPSVDLPWTTQTPLYQDVYAQGSDTPAAMVQHVSAAASLPVVRGGQTVGVFITVLFERWAWSRTDRAVLETVVRSLELALGRAEEVRQREEVARAQDTFVRFTETASRIDDLDTLILEAFGTLGALFPGLTAVFMEWREGRWHARQRTDTIPPALGAVLDAGLPPETPIFLQAVQERAPVFVDGWTAEAGGVAHSGRYQTVALYPIEQNGEVRAALSVALEQQASWTELDRATIRAVGRSFSLLYERIAAAEVLRLRQREAESRTRVLEAFSQLTSDLTVQLDRAALVRRAQEVSLSLLPTGYAAYFEPQDGHWHLRSVAGGAEDDAVQTALARLHGPAELPSVVASWRSGEAQYHDFYDSAHPAFGGVRAAMTAPVCVGGVAVGVFALGLFGQNTWSPEDRTVLETVLTSLTLALERAQSVAQLAERSAELEQSNRSLERSNSELQAANEELEAFTYSVSHDLRTPIRHIKGFAELAAKALAPAVGAPANPAATPAQTIPPQRLPAPEKALQHLKVVEQAADRMWALIDSMLDLSRTTRSALTPAPVDLNVLLEQARQDIAQTERRLTWEIGPLPTVPGDPGMLQQVFTNLIDNALKFSGRETHAVIRVWADDQPGEWVIHVQDNGVGFDPEYRNKLFGVFQRLHQQRDFEGTGVGLATVRRIVARHGGQVYAESVLGQGAVFSFSLPKPD